MDSDMKERLRVQAIDDCIEYGTPTMGVDHSNHYKPVPYPTRTAPTDKKGEISND